MTVTRESKLFEAAGAILFGYAWRVDMSEALGVDQRTIRKWLIGRDPIPRGVWIDILDLAAKRQKEIAIMAAIVAAKPTED